MPLEIEKNSAVFCPKNIAELDRIIEQQRDKITYLAGATDLLVQADHWRTARTVVDLRGVEEINHSIEMTTTGFQIGAAVVLTDIIQHPNIREQFPILVEACRQVGSVQIQNRATLGGNIANASPAGDSLPVLNVLNAELRIGPRNKGNFRQIKIDQMMTGPGQTILKNNEYIGYIFIPILRQENLCWYFRKVGQRQSMAISKLSLAVLGWINGGKVEHIRISAGAVSATVHRAVNTEKLLNGQQLTERLIEKAKASLENEVSPIADIRSTIEYRRRVAGELLREALFSFLR